MPRIAIKVAMSDNWMVIVEKLSKVENVGVVTLKARLESSIPVFERELFGNDHNAVADQFTSLVNFLEEIGSSYQLYEFEGELPESFQWEKYQIDKNVLENILASHEKEVTRQQKITYAELKRDPLSKDRR